MQTVREFGNFNKDALELLGQDGYENFINFIALNPESGNLIAGTGGFRKVRWVRGGKGKRGGVRVIYFYVSDHAPISLFFIYAKGKMDTLTGAQKAELFEASKHLKKGI